MRLEEFRKTIVDNFMKDCIVDEAEWIINEDGSIDVFGNVSTIPYKFLKIPFKFRKIYGNFNCSYSYMDNLKNCPDEVKDYFCCSHNQLTSLEFSPKKCGSFLCGNNAIQFTKEDVRKICEVSGGITV